MKRQFKVLLLGLGAVFIASAAPIPVYAQGMGRNSQGMMSGNYSGNQTMMGAVVTPTTTTSALNANEVKTLQYMVEEEKLAHDIYIKLYEKWGAGVFSNISRSETMHQSMLLSAAKTYGVADTRSAQVGVFTNPDLQKLYDSLLTKGQSSQAAAYEVGKSVEEVDIADLAKAMTVTDSTYLDTVYLKLQKGSQNHLRAFANKL